VSLECCCFIDDKEYLSGSDDGSLELWSVMRKKPTHIIKNAHPALTPSSLDSADEKLPKGKRHFLNSAALFSALNKEQFLLMQDMAGIYHYLFSPL
jgi:hypothetical protein